MSLQLGDVAPDFTAPSTSGPIDFHKAIGGSWAILSSHPKDFTPVCTTELGEVARLKPEFDRRNVKVIAISVDPLDSHAGWVKDINETQHTSMNFPIIADADRTVAQAYDMIAPAQDNKATVRSVFVIDPSKKLRLSLTYPASTGRNFDEILRVVDSLQLTDNRKVATPANWRKGDKVVILPGVSNDEAKKLFPQGWDEQRPYLRLTEIKD